MSSVLSTQHEATWSTRFAVDQGLLDDAPRGVVVFGPIEFLVGFAAPPRLERRGRGRH
jgi:hypothetical protein